MTKLFGMKLIAVLLLMLNSSLNFANDTTPEKVVAKLHQSLLQSMKEGGSLNYQARYNNLEPVVLASFDFKTITRIVLGRHWKKLDNAQRSQFIDVFSKLSIATYTSQFKRFSRQSFEYLNDEMMTRGRVVLKTQFVTEDRLVSFNYILHSVEDKWLIINVITDGVSDLSLKKSDYATIMKTEGFDGLVKKLLEKVRKLGIKP